MGKSRWQVLASGASSERLSAQEISQEFSLPHWAAEIIAQRSEGWRSSNRESIHRFLNPSLKDLPDPFLLPDMDKAAERVAQAVLNREQIAVYGDYDVDGTVGAAILRRFFRGLGLEPFVYQPDRRHEGYGLNCAAIDFLRGKGTQLLISVDCGISNVKEAAHAKSLGLDLIITDHHEVPDPMPDAYAVVDHKRRDNTSPIDSLCGAGMGFYLALAVRARLREKGFFSGVVKEPDLKELLDLVAVATVADMVPLVDENRVLARIGLEKMRRKPQVGIAAICKVANVDPRELGTYHIGFVIGPRINASGRLGSANAALELLSTDDEAEALQLAQELNRVNGERLDLTREITRSATIEAEELLEARGQDWPAIVVASDEWHEGVIGIVAARLVERFHRPAIVCALDLEKGTGKGSVRSVKGVDVLHCLESSRDILLGFGGHKAAAGLSFDIDNFDEIQERFAIAVGDEVAKVRGDEIRLMDKVLNLDADLSEVDLSSDSVKMLERLGPFGIGNPEPVMLARGLGVVSKKIMKEAHLKLELRTKGNLVQEALWFNATKGKDLELGALIDLAFTPQMSSFRGRERLELRVRDLLVSGEGEARV
jgi:single-stranded-DNA-specific exonuclease